MKSKLIINIALLFLIANVVYSQDEDNNDFAIWNSIGIKYSPVKNLKLGVEQNLRLKEDASVTDEYFTEVFANYEVINGFTIGGGMRFIKENDNAGKIQGYEKHFRYNVDLSYKMDFINKFDISFRLRYQNKKELDLEDGVEDIASENLRFKTGIEYNIKNWPLDPEFAVEIFNRKRDGLSFINDAKLSRFRLTLGTSYSLKKFGKFGVFYRYQENTRIDNDFKTKVLGIKYTYSIN